VVELARIVGAANVSSLDADRLAYARDAWVREQLVSEGGRLTAAPGAVVWPESAEEASRVLSLLEREGIPAVPFGAGSGRGGASQPTEGGVVVDVKRMSSVRSLVAEDLRIEVEAGIIGARLERWLEARNLTLGHHPESLQFSTVGGWIATRSAGQYSPGYGKIDHLTYGLEVVTPGQIRRQRRGPRPLDGPDANGLLLGSEGTLGLITAAELRVRPRPAARRPFAWRFPSLEAGLEAVRRLLRERVVPTGFRLFDRLESVMVRSFLQGGSPRLDQWAAFFAGRQPKRRGWERLGQGLLRRAARQLASTPRLINQGMWALPEDCLLLATFDGAPAQVEAEVHEAAQACEREGGEAEPKGLAERWFKLGHEYRFDLARWARAGMYVDEIDVSTTWDRVMPLYRAVHRALAKEAVVTAHFAHGCSEGCALNFTFAGLLTDPNRPSTTVERYERGLKAALSACHEAGGSCSHHRGVGLARQHALPRELGPGGMRVLAAVKDAFDPTGVMNPGKLPPYASRPSFERSGPRAELPAQIKNAVGEQNVTRSGGRTIVRPPDEGALAAVLRVSTPRGTPVFCDQTGFRPPSGAVQLDLSRLDHVQRLSDYGLFVEVEAGVVVHRLEKLLQSHGLTLGPVHPRAWNRSVGAGVSRNILVRRGSGYGELSDLCFGLRGLLPDGTAVEVRAVPESAAGPRLKELWIGGHGRLGILTKLTLRVALRSEHRAHIVYAFDDLESGVTASRRLHQRGVRPAACRLVPAREGVRLAVLLVSPTAGLRRAAMAVVSGAVSASDGRRADDEVQAEGGRFDVVVECAQRWSRVADTAAALDAAGAKEVWIDFMTADSVTVVARLEDNQSRAAVVQAGVDCGGRIVAGSRSRAPIDRESYAVEPGATMEPTRPRGPYEDVLDRLAQRLDPTALLADRGVASRTGLG
jgi:alkyldihydroxyacetonephosphate synthase